MNARYRHIALLCLSVMLVVTGCASVADRGEPLGLVDEESGLSVRLWSLREVQRHFGPGPQENPFIPWRGLVTGGKNFYVFSIANRSGQAQSIKEVTYTDTSGNELGSVIDTQALIRYWEGYKKLSDTLDAKKDILARECLGDSGLVKNGSRKLIVVDSKKAITVPFVILVELMDGNRIPFEIDALPAEK